MANNNNDLVFYQQWAAAGQQIDKYSMQPWCVDSENLDIFSDSQAIKWMPWSSKEVVNNQWVDVDPKGRFYLASDGRVYDSVEDVWYNHDYFDENANKIDYWNWTYVKAVFWTPKKLMVAYSWDDWMTITIVTDRLIYNIYHYEVLVQWRLAYSQNCSNDWSTSASIRVAYNSTSAAQANISPDQTITFARMRYVIQVSGSPFTNFRFFIMKNKIQWNNAIHDFDITKSQADETLVDENIWSVASWYQYTWECFFDNFFHESVWTQLYQSWIRIDCNCSDPEWLVYVYFYMKESWDYLYPKNRKIIQIEDEVYMEWLDSTEYDMMYYDPLEDKRWNVYYDLILWNEIDFPDGYEIVWFARSFDYQYVFVNKWDMWIVYLTTDANLAAWDSWWRFPWTKFINAIMIWTYAYVIAEKRWVRWLYVFYNWDMKLLVWANNKYTEDLDLINWKEIFNFTGIMANWRDKVVCSTKDSVFMWWATKLGNNAGAFILKVDWEITDISTERWYLDVYYTKNNTTYRQSIQDDVNIRDYESEFSVTYPVQISSHLIEKEPLSLALSYNLPNDNTNLEAYINVNDNYFWSFLTDWEVTPEEWAKYKVSWLSWDYWLNFVEKKWNWLTFYLSGDLPYQTSNTKNLVSEDTEQTIAFTDFNHFKYLWEAKKTDPEEIDWKHTYLNLTTKNDLPIVRKAQVKIIWITDNHTTPEIYWIRLLSNQFDK